MSVRVSTAVWSHSRTSGTVFLLMLALADQANDEGYCWPRRRTLARRLRVKEERSVSKLVARAVEQGELTVFPNFNDGRQTSNRYQINLAHLRSLPDLWGEGVHLDRGGCPDGQGEGVQLDRGEGVPADRVITVSKNHQLNRTTPPTPQGERMEVALPEWLPEETWADWTAYRRERKAPITPTTRKALLSTLTKLRAEGHDPVQVINQSISTGRWTGLFPVKSSARAGRPSNQAEANQQFVQGVQDTVDAVKGIFDD